MILSASEDIAPISEGKARFAELLDRTRENHRPIVFTQNGRATGVLVAIEDWEERERDPHRGRPIHAQGGGAAVAAVIPLLTPQGFGGFGTCRKVSRQAVSTGQFQRVTSCGDIFGRSARAIFITKRLEAA